MDPSETPASPTDRDARIASRAEALPWLALEQLSHLDPAGRGLASYRLAGAMLDAGQLRAASLELALHARRVALLCGFPVQTSRGVAAETDGPPSALYLARALLEAGVEVTLVCDELCLPLLAAGRELWKLERATLVEFAASDARTPERLDHWLARVEADRWSHVISIERPGASHTLESPERQPRSTEPPRERFLACVPESSRNRCHNMRGEPIDALAPPAFAIFDRIVERRLPITTIGIGDGGNEIGMGHYPWEVLVEALGGSAAPEIVSRVTTDFALIGGTSDWAGYALALAFAVLVDASDRGQLWGTRAQGKLIECLVEAGAVDGITRQPQPTVDGLPLETYLAPLAEMRRLLGLAAG